MATLPVYFMNRQNWLYKCYQELLRWIPQLHLVFAQNSGVHFNKILKALLAGADSACGNDASRLKTAVVSWLMSMTPPPQPALLPYDKTGRGFYNDATARLLCPVDYDWDNPQHRQNIWDYHPDFLITANLWPLFLYANGKYNPNFPNHSLFKGELLVKVFRYIFTSLLSAEFTSDDLDSEFLLAQPKRHRRSPCAIAYIAVQLHFALASCGSWCIIDVFLDYHQFYKNIVTFFEDVADTEAEEFIKELVLWWNRQVFGPVSMINYIPQATDNMSVAASFKKHRTANISNSGST
ncbi:hypothetical protein SCLCIDRAFT_22310 [Scleroderma citrinum Foug A]|uniref:Uncharacterized protein n=1 Tax=Scleroderma citrinum Foug A TaxID=1036808 RepID=A0A0C3E009_9AGAM|nr:hypothetical protein SCLCIDRAFT_22310 [Scleroderma citrinum Foug A]